MCPSSSSISSTTTPVVSSSTTNLDNNHTAAGDSVIKSIRSSPPPPPPSLVMSQPTTPRPNTMVSSADSTTTLYADQAITSTKYENGHSGSGGLCKAADDVYATTLVPMTTATSGAVDSVSVQHPQPPQPLPSHNQQHRRRDPIMHPFHDGPSFGPTRYNRNIYALDHSTIMGIDLHARIDRGFFRADNDWTCYRRNYFQLTSGFSLHGMTMPLYENGQEIPSCRVRCSINGQDELHPISSFMLGVTARIANSDKPIQLVQLTAKRDKGPQSTPSPLPLRPDTPDAPVQSSSTRVTFERIQFKSATANNGKRRAAQQYYQLVVQLYAQVQTSSTLLVPVAMIESDHLVVRGRSPGHYGDLVSARSHHRRTSTTSQSNQQQHPTAFHHWSQGSNNRFLPLPHQFQANQSQPNSSSSPTTPYPYLNNPPFLPPPTHNET
ncbi:p53-like transcription factor [Lichtheimia hyalospora FSU 10163]|nr:p53-like transcription factor [Lichtheimia hyalospora FSU 10163]